MSDIDHNEFVQLLNGGFAAGSAQFAMHAADEQRANKYLDALIESGKTWADVEGHFEALLQQKSWNSDSTESQKDRLRQFVFPWLQSEPESIAKELCYQIVKAEDREMLEDLRLRAIGKKGRISYMMKTLGKMDPEARKEMGPKLNVLKNMVVQAVELQKEKLEDAELDARLASEKADLTLPPRPYRTGTLHPVMQVFEEIEEIFGAMGFAVAEGPDIEDDFHNFTALNFPIGHPAREDHDTFFMTPDAEGERKVLRTHTSPVQIRTMMSQEPPIRVIIPGRVYRNDWDATHTPMFHQVEGLVIDKVSHMGHLKGCLTDFARAFFEVDEVETRFRPHFFPFTEPSAEMDVKCDRSGGTVKVGQGEDWLEVLGSGMVHPNVLRNCGLDPNEYQGFAFGMGVDRLAMLKYGMPDLRPYFESDVRWLSHYGFTPWLLPSLSGGLS